MRGKSKALTILAVLFLFSASVFAEAPKGTVIIGKKGYSLEYTNNPQNVKEIQNAIKEMEKDETIYVKNLKGIWYSNDGKKISENVVGEFALLNSDGTFTNFRGEEIVGDSSFRVNNIAYTGIDEIEVVFSEPIKRQDYKKLINVDGYLKVKSVSASSDRKRLFIKTEKLETQRYDSNIKISKDIISNKGKKLGSDYSREIAAFKKTTEEDRTFDINVSLLLDDYNGDNLKFKKGVSIAGGNSKLKNCTAPFIIINQDGTGGMTLEDVKTDKLIVYSSGSRSINLDNCEIGEIIVDSNKETIIINEESKIKEAVVVVSDLEIQSQESDIDKIIIKDKEVGEPLTKLTLITDVNNIQAGNNSLIVTEYSSKVKKIVINGSVQLMGDFDKVDAQNKESKIIIKEGSNIGYIDVNENTKIDIDGSVQITNIKGNEEVVKDIRNKVEEAEKDSDDEGYTGLGYSTRSIDTEHVDVTLHEYKKPIKANGRKLNKHILDMKFSKDFFTEKEIKNGVLLYVYDYDNVIQDIRIIKPTSKDKIEKLVMYLPYRINRVFIYTEKYESIQLEI